jgi:hypothetical protein
MLCVLNIRSKASDESRVEEGIKTNEEEEDKEQKML